jgi:hypothetical protein
MHYNVADEIHAGKQYPGVLAVTPPSHPNSIVFIWKHAHAWHEILITMWHPSGWPLRCG